MLNTNGCLHQNKKRKYRDEPIGRETTPEEPEDPLKDAATLYVGNLYVFAKRYPALCLGPVGHSIRLRNRFMSCLQSMDLVASVQFNLLRLPGVARSSD